MSAEAALFGNLLIIAELPDASDRIAFCDRYRKTRQSLIINFLMRCTRTRQQQKEKKMNKQTEKMSAIRKLTLLALLSAIVVVLQLLGSFIRFGGFSVTLVLVPIVVGASMLGVGAGAWLGLVFGLTVLISGDAASFLSISVVGTLVTVLLKGVLSGLAAGAVYKLLEKKNEMAAIICAAIVCPLVNTGVFLLGCLAFFFNAISEIAAGSGQSAFAYIIFVYIGGNFIFEMLFNIVLAPVITRVIAIGRKMLNKRNA